MIPEVHFLLDLFSIRADEKIPSFWLLFPITVIDAAATEGTGKAVRKKETHNPRMNDLYKQFFTLFEPTKSCDSMKSQQNVTAM